MMAMMIYFVKEPLNVALSSATHHAMPPELDDMWEAECLNTAICLKKLKKKRKKKL